MMAKGYLWKNVETGEEVISRRRYVVNNDGVYVNFGKNECGTYICDYGPEDVWRLSEVNTSGNPTVHYNKTTGNTIIIRYYHPCGTVEGVYAGKVVSYTDDFEPDTEGATYIFRNDAGEVKLTIGSPFPDPDGIIDGQQIFTGAWLYNQYATKPEYMISKPSGGSYRYVSMDYDSDKRKLIPIISGMSV